MKRRVSEFLTRQAPRRPSTRAKSSPAKRFETYKMFSELAGHPTMKSALMMRPQHGDAVIGPFMEA